MQSTNNKVASRLNKSLKKVPDWASNLGLPAKFFEQYIAGQGNILLAIDGFFGLFSLGMDEIKRSLLAANSGNTKVATNSMNSGFRRILYASQIEILMATNSDGSQDCIENLDGATQLMLGALSTGAPELVNPFYRVLLENLSSGFGVGDGHNPPLGTTLRYAAFGLTIIGDWLGKPLDLDKHALPRDPAWGQLVAHWREPDPEKFLPVILAACDTHVERIALTEKEDDSGHFEFGSVFLAVHPTEILAVLRLRDMLGLPNPAYIDHPLMQTPYAAITCLPGDVTERDELLENFLAVVRQRDPQVLPVGI